MDEEHARLVRSAPVQEVDPVAGVGLDDEALRTWGSRLTRAIPLDELLLQLAETLRKGWYFLFVIALLMELYGTYAGDGRIEEVGGFLLYFVNVNEGQLKAREEEAKARVA